MTTYKSSLLKESFLKQLKMGYLPVWKPATNVKFWHIKDKDFVQVSKLDVKSEKKVVVAIIPSHIYRTNWLTHKEALSSLIRQFSVPFDGFDIYLIVALQWRNDNDESVAVDRLKELILYNFPNIKMYGLTMQSERKIDTLNSVFEIGNSSTQKPDYYSWFDDDIVLDNNCISNMLSKAANNSGAAIGAKKIGLMRDDIGSKVVYYAKKVTKPAVNYPHGCAIIVPADLLNKGIPNTFASDDGFICFEMLDINHPNPFHRLIIAENAICYHKVGAGKNNNRKRLRRLLINHWVMIMNYPDKAHIYIKKSLFWGFWPVSKVDYTESLWFISLRWLLKLIYFLMFSWVGAELFFRGVTKKPLKNFSWGGTY